MLLTITDFIDENKGKLFILCIAIGIGVYYLFHTYIPEKRLEAAVEEIVSKLDSEDVEIKTDYAYYVLRSDHEWGYEDINDNDISYKLLEYSEKAFHIIESEAYAGNASAQFLLGQLYYWAEWYDYVNCDYSKAAYWYNEAASQNYTPAYNRIGVCYKEGTGVEKSLTKAFEFFMKGAEAGNKWAQLNLGDCYKDGVKYYILGDGDIYYYIDKSHPDIEQAKYWWGKAAAQGNETAKNRLQKIYN